MSLEHVVFVGGSPCAGKSTLAERVSSAFGRRYVRCDDRWEDHVRAADPARQPTIARLGSMSFAEIFAQSAQVMLRDEIEAYREEWAFIRAELEAMPSPVIAEGAALMPELIASLEPEAHAAYLVPTEAFQREHYAQREWAWSLVNQTPDPSGTFERWMTRDARFADHVRAAALEYGFPVLVVDGSITIKETQVWLENALGLG